LAVFKETRKKHLAYQIFNKERMKRFIGTWQNGGGNKLVIKEKDLNTLSVTLISGKTNEPIIRPFVDNLPTVDMEAELDFYETSLEVELWKKGKGFHLCLLYDDYSGSQPELSPGISMYQEDREASKYSNLFDPLDRYVKTKE
jgi:hypothetical protein